MILDDGIGIYAARFSQDVKLCERRDFAAILQPKNHTATAHSYQSTHSIFVLMAVPRYSRAGSETRKVDKSPDGIIGREP